jgi:hypothetical protein
MMSSVISFAKMDWLTFKPYRKYYTLFLLQFIFIFAANAHAVSLCVLTNMMLAGMLPSYLFAGEDKSKMDRLYTALPIHKKEVVIGRYFGGAVIGLGCILVTALLLTVDSTLTSAFLFQDVVNGFSVSTGIFFVMMALQFPFLFQLGFIKAQNFTMLLPAMVLLWVNLIWRNGYFQAMSHLNNAIGAAFLLIGLICIGISLWVSIMIYQAKEQ